MTMDYLENNEATGLGIGQSSEDNMPEEEQPISAKIADAGQEGETATELSAAEPDAGAMEPPEAAPKKKRTSRKRAEQSEEPATLGGAEPAEEPVSSMDAGGLPDTGTFSIEGGTSLDVGGLPHNDEDQLAPVISQTPGENCIVMGLAEESGGESPLEPPVVSGEDVPLPVPSGGTPALERQNAPRSQTAGRRVEGHSPLLSLKLNDLDRNLTEQERQEWNDIYASFRSKSVLTGHIIGVDSHAFSVRNRETGEIERRNIYCSAIISYRVKVLIPETEMWMPGEERPSHVLRNMSGAEIDYVILDVDRKGGVAIGSRRMGAMIARRAFDTARGGHEPGERLTCRVLTVGPSRCLVECGGRDLTLRYQDISYSSYSDLRTRYHSGEKLDCILKGYDRADGRLTISVKEAAPNPFEGVASRHPLGCRRQAVISGKYGGGVFCTMPDDTTCLCLYTAQHTDRDFREGDTVILVIVKYDYERSLIYGRILSKW